MNVSGGRMQHNFASNELRLHIFIHFLIEFPPPRGLGLQHLHQLGHDIWELGRLLQHFNDIAQPFHHFRVTCRCQNAIRCYLINSPTSLLSPSNSSVVILIFAFAKSSRSNPDITSHCCPSLRTGNPNCRPAGTPYSPLLTTASAAQSPCFVARRMLFTESIAALAALAADDRPRALMTAAPRFCTLLIKSPCSHAGSEMTSYAGRPEIHAFFASGNCVAE